MDRGARRVGTLAGGGVLRGVAREQRPAGSDAGVAVEAHAYTFGCSQVNPPGGVAEWLGRGLQNLVQRFNSAPRL